MNYTCPEHRLEFRQIPAGFSRTKKDENGNPKAYAAFWSCPKMGCRQKPPTEKDKVLADMESDRQYIDESQQPPIDMPEPTKAPIKDENAVWDAKDRMNMAQSALKAAAEVISAQINVNFEGIDIEMRFDELKEKNYKWLVEKKEGKNA